MALSLTAADFLQAPGVLLDARSPGEYAHGHIPGAHSFPLFDDQERAQVGTCYKQQGREPAIELGLELVGPKLARFVTTAKTLAVDRRVRLHCWRGGMRSSSLAWLLETAGLEVTLLERGYKAFRHWVHNTLATPKPLITLGGMTGTGKTTVLQALGALGEQVLDLEALANHRGSSYGNLGLPPQPTTEQFENLVAFAWNVLDDRRPIWVEAESRRIGTCCIPYELFTPMLQAPILQIERPRSERIALLLQDYGSIEAADLIKATERIRKRLGGADTLAAVNWIREGNLAPAIERILNYYDKTYTYDLQRRNVPIYTVDATGLSPQETADRLRQQAQQIFSLSSPTVPPLCTQGSPG